MPKFKKPLDPTQIKVNESEDKYKPNLRTFLDKGIKPKEKINYQARNASSDTCPPNHLDINEITLLVNEECLVLYFEGVLNSFDYTFDNTFN